MTLEVLADFSVEGFSSLIREFWRVWFIGGANPSEGRELGNPKREYWREAEGLPYWIGLNEAEGLPSYMSVAVYVERDSPVALDRLFYDFDSGEADGLEATWSDAQEFSSALRRRYGCEPLVVFSGRKGFHVYAWLREAYRGPRLKEVYRELQTMTLRGLSLPTLDRAILGDVKRLSRIPYSRHEKAGSLCLPVNERGEPMLVDAESLWAMRGRGLPPDLIELGVSRVERRLRAEEELKKRIRRLRRRFRPRTRFRLRTKGLRPCLKAVLEAGNIHTPSHKAKHALVCELLAEGWSEASIVSAFSGMAGFKRSLTAYMVRHTIKREYHPYRCDTLQALGICLREACPIYRRRRG